MVNSGVVSFILLKVIDMVMGIRVTEEEEQGGLEWYSKAKSLCS